MFGSLLDYSAETGMSASEVQYVRVYMSAGVEIEQLETFIAVQKNADIRMGIYAQASASDINGLPVSKVAETAAYTLQAADDRSFVIRNLVTNYTVPDSGYYWLGLICDAANVKFQKTNPYGSGYLPRYFQASSAVNLPATAGGLSNPTNSDVAYMSAVQA